MKYLQRILLLVCTISLFGCSDDVNFKDYYFQVNEFTQTKVYKFECPDFGLVEYWEMTYFPNEEVFYTKMYNEELEETYFLKERITATGAKAQSFGRTNLFDQDKGKLTLDKVLLPDVYLWDTKGPYSYQVEFNENDEDHQTLERERVFVEFTSTVAGGKKYATAKFKDKFTLVNHTKSESYSYTNFSYYALGVGCVKIEMEGSNGNYADSELTQIISGGEWAKLLSTKN